MITLTALLVRRILSAGPRGVVLLERELSGDFLERILGVRESELVAKEGRFRRSAVGGRGCSYGAEGRLDVLLSLLHQVRDVEHVRTGQAVQGEWARRQGNCSCSSLRAETLRSLISSQRYRELSGM